MLARCHALIKAAQRLLWWSAHLARVVWHKLSPFSVGVFGRPIYAIQHITDVCPLHCSGCFVDINRDNRFLSPERAGTLARRLGPTPFLVLTGGEPLSHPRLFEVLRVYVTVCHPLAVHIPTSGYHPGRLAKLLKDWQEWTSATNRSFGNSPGKRNRPVFTRLGLTFSVDGADPGGHDSIRGRSGSWRRVMTSLALTEREIRRARKKSGQPNLEYSVSFTLRPENTGQYQPVRQAIANRNSYRHRQDFNLLLLRPPPAVGEPTTQPVHHFPRDLAAAWSPRQSRQFAEIYRDHLKWLARETKKKPEKKENPLAGPGRLWRAQKNRKDKYIYEKNLAGLTTATDGGGNIRPEKTANCPAGRSILAIDYNGNLWPCENMAAKIHSDEPTSVRRKKLKEFYNYQTGQGCNCSHECYLGLAAALRNDFFEPGHRGAD